MRIITTLAAIVATAFLALPAGAQESGPPGSATCDALGLTGAALGMCHAGIAAGCNGGIDARPRACDRIEERYIELTGEIPPWACDPICGEGLVCCNASCNICTPPDGFCIQIACE